MLFSETDSDEPPERARRPMRNTTKLIADHQGYGGNYHPFLGNLFSRC